MNANLNEHISRIKSNNPNKSNERLIELDLGKQNEFKSEDRLDTQRSKASQQKYTDPNQVNPLESILEVDAIIYNKKPKDETNVNSTMEIIDKDSSIKKSIKFAKSEEESMVLKVQENQENQESGGNKDRTLSPVRKMSQVNKLSPILRKQTLRDKINKIGTLNKPLEIDTENNNNRNNINKIIQEEENLKSNSADRNNLLSNSFENNRREGRKDQNKSNKRGNSKKNDDSIPNGLQTFNSEDNSSPNSHRVKKSGSKNLLSDENNNQVKNVVVNSQQNNEPVIEENDCKVVLRTALDYWLTTIIFSVLTIFVLFSDDIKMISTDKSADTGFDITTIIILIIFTIELILSCVAIPGYLGNFFFWLDLISILTMFLDISWINDLIVNILSDTGGVGNGAIGAISIARAGRGAKIGSRAIRVLRVLRLVRLVRIAKLYKASQKITDKISNNKKQALKDDKDKENVEKVKNEREEEIIPEESKVGKKLTDLTTKRTIVLVLSLLIAIILFNSNFYLITFTPMEFGLKIFNEFKDPNDLNINRTALIYINMFKPDQNTTTPILYANIINYTYGDINITDTYRNDEMLKYQEDCNGFYINPKNESNCISIFDNKNASKNNAIMNIAKTIFICTILTLGSMSFTSSTNDMVLEPIEKIIKKIKDISENPLEAVHKSEEMEYILCIEDEENKENNPCYERDKKVNNLETIMLEKTITKIGALLALGFGEAGSGLIAENMKNSKEGNVNPLMKGKKVMAIYAFCDIRNFTDSTEVLREDVMIFVNEIADIVHGITTEFLGSANKNIGDAFLLVWKFDSQYVEEKKGDISLVNGNRTVTQLADLSLVAILKIIINIHKSFCLKKYRENVDLKSRIEKPDKPNEKYQVKLGFGLHVGWSIEGAIGSAFKIDSSYLSSHVNLANRLEEKTKEYFANLIMRYFLFTYLIFTSNDFVNLLSKDAQAYTRCLDNIHFEEIGDTCKIKSYKFKAIFTIDMDLKRIPFETEPKKPIQTLTPLEERFKNYLDRDRRNNLRKEIETSDYNAWEEFVIQDDEFIESRKSFNDEFSELYYLGFDAYTNGDWLEAKEKFEQATNELKTINNEKLEICQGLLNYMEKHHFIAPENWEGYRESDGGH